MGSRSRKVSLFYKGIAGIWMKTLKQLFSKIRVLKHYLLANFWTFDQSVLRLNTTAKPSTFIPELAGPSNHSNRILVACHVYYPEFVEVITKSAGDFSENVVFAFTTPDLRVADEIKAKMSLVGRKFQVIHSKNIGRNFGPLLVELSTVVPDFDYILHMHSKRSDHNRNGLGASWSERNFELFLKPSNFERAMQILQNDPEIGLVYADCSDLLRKINYRWGVNLNLIRDGKFRGLYKQALECDNYIAFPAGGMFLAKTQALKPLFDLTWSYDDFPRELGQLDGTMQHAVERLIGVIPETLGFKHAVFVSKLNRFTSENRYFLSQDLNAE